MAGYEGVFLVSKCGKIHSMRTGRLLKLGLSSGYPVLSSRIGGRAGKSVCLRVHRLVAEAYLPPPPAEVVIECALRGMTYIPVNHIDGNKQNNRAENLEWTTPTLNARHARDNGLLRSQVGSSNNSAKLDPRRVREIKRRYTPGCRVNGGRALAAEYGVAKTTVQDVVAGRKWREVAA